MSYNELPTTNIEVQIEDSCCRHEATRLSQISFQ